jgi:hypothetical protein
VTSCSPTCHSSVQLNSAALQRRCQLPVDHLGLLLLSRRVGFVGAGVQADLAQHQRPVAGEVLQPREVAAEVELPLQEDVEREEIHRLQRQVLGGGDVRVGHQAVGIRGADGLPGAPHGVGDVVGAHPPDDVAGNLVAHHEPQHPLIAAQPLGFRRARLDHPPSDRALLVAAVTELVAPIGDEHPGKHRQPVPSGGLQQVRRGRGVGAQHGEARLGHRRHVGLEPPRLGEAGAVAFPWSEGAVGDPAHREVTSVAEKELAVELEGHDHPHGPGGLVQFVSGGLPLAVTYFIRIITTVCVNDEGRCC